jgi:cellulose biosynthesis protein BcsQ
VPKSITFHSYKGGTGKTTIACNLAALLAAKGFRVSLLDFDVYAPSISAYFGQTPKKWINDLLLDGADIRDVMTDITPALNARRFTIKGKLWVGLSNPHKEAIYKMESGKVDVDPAARSLRRFVRMKEDLVSDYDCDYVILDTSPGIRNWSLNCLAVTDVLFLTLKFGDFDIEGTQRLAAEIYGSLRKSGTKSYLLLNRVGGYCVPNVDAKIRSGERANAQEGANLDDVIKQQILSSSMDVILAILCYCDMQFSPREFLTALQNPDHPFAKQMERLSLSAEIRV